MNVEWDNATLPVHDRLCALRIITLIWRQRTDKWLLEPVEELPILFWRCNALKTTHCSQTIIRYVERQQVCTYVASCIHLLRILVSYHWPVVEQYHFLCDCSNEWICAIACGVLHLYPWKYNQQKGGKIEWYDKEIVQWRIEPVTYRRIIFSQATVHRSPSTMIRYVDMQEVCTRP